MLSYTQRRNLYAKFTRNSTTENLDLGDTLMNQEEKRIINARAWDFTQRTTTRTTVANQQFYNLPVNYKRLIGKPTITVGTTTYVIEEAIDRADWDYLNSVSNSSDIPQYFYIFNKQIGFYPKSSSNGNTITLPYELQSVDLNTADYSTGTIASIANGGTTVEGNSTSWTSGMAGKYIQITSDNTADSGDNSWYEIDSITDADTLELVLPYEGTSISGATQGYNIGQFSQLPDGYEMLPIWKAAEQYWLQNIDIAKSDRFKRLYDELFDVMKEDRLTKTSNLVVDEIGYDKLKNPNLYLTQ